MMCSSNAIPVRSASQWLSLILLSELILDNQATARELGRELISTRPQNPYLKEILLGRCYENPPNHSPAGGAQLCPVVVDVFLDVLNGQLDHNIETGSYYMFLGWTKYEIQKDSALFVWPPSTTVDAFGSLDLILPETTPTGALVEGLVFCGLDRQSNCPTEFWKQDKGAALSFWQAVYAQFASKAEGRVRMVMLEDAVPSLWKDQVLLNLVNVSSVEVIAANCDAPAVNDWIDHLLSSLGNDDVNCSCTQIETNRSNQGGLANSCEIGDLLRSFSPATTDDHSPAPSIVDSECPPSVYMFLFWGLIVFGAAGAYSIWSVWHYLPEYQRVPNVESELTEGRAVLPKQ